MVWVMFRLVGNRSLFVNRCSGGVFGVSRLNFIHSSRQLFSEEDKVVDHEVMDLENEVNSEDAVESENTADEEKVTKKKRVRTKKKRQEDARNDESVEMLEMEEDDPVEIFVSYARSMLLANSTTEAQLILEQIHKRGHRVPLRMAASVMWQWLKSAHPNKHKRVTDMYALVKSSSTSRLLVYASMYGMALLSAMRRNNLELTKGILKVLVGHNRDMVEVVRDLVKLQKEQPDEFADLAQLVEDTKSKVKEDDLKQVLQVFFEELTTEPEQETYLKLDMDEVDMSPEYIEQFNNEARATTDAVNKYRSDLEIVIRTRKGAATAPAQDLLLLWHEPLSRAIAEEHRNIGNRVPGKDRSVYGEKLLQVDAERLSVITIHETLGTLMAHPTGVRFTSLAMTIGNAVLAEYNFAKQRAEGNVILRYLRTTGQHVTVSNLNKAAKGFSEEYVWPPKLLVKVGSVLIDLLLKSARAPPNMTLHDVVKARKGEEEVLSYETWVPAFKHEYHQVQKKKYGVVTCLPEVLAVIQTKQAIKETMNARYLPMIVPPRKWETPYVGGYLAYRTGVMRTKGSELQRELLKNAQLQQVYDALDILGETPWKINTFVLDTMKDLWSQGGGVLDLPSLTDLTIPEPPEDFLDDVTARKRFLMEQRREIQKQRDLHGLRCSLRYQLAIAEEFKDRVFYFPHNVDFRGRAYPIPPHLNQMGSDLSRGLLTFAEKKPLGPTGLDWLKTQLANLMGNDKIPRIERIRFIDEHLDEVKLSARDPLGEGSWWKQADSPWQALGVCKAITDALDMDRPDLYLCDLPVHQDGSCNGLQHYAALGGDVIGAQQVNLLPCDRPQDVYGGVAKLVQERVKKDAEAGHKYAILLADNVDRKIVKQTVMTSVYGVTFVGARKQIYNAMKDRLNLSEEDIYNASPYLTKLTFEALQEMFLGAREIMAWLGECARSIAKEGEPVTWISPLGLPIVQPYRRAGRSAIVTLVQTVILEDKNDKLPVNVQRQKTAFAPNYVHSLDSTHMMLTARATRERGITFASVHDSFWTHAADVEVMNDCLRESFVMLHSEPLLEQLREYFQTRYPKVKFPPLPARGTLDIKEVLKSPYFFH